MRLLMVFFTSLISVMPANAVVNDPQDYLGKVDTFLGFTPFEVAFQLNDEIKFLFNECIGGINCESSYLTLTKVEPLSQNEVAVNSYGTDGKIKSTTKITPAKWNGVHQNYLRAKIKAIESFGLDITIQSLETVFCPEESFIHPQHQCLRIKLSAKNNLKYESQYEYTIWNTPVAIAQIYEYIQTDIKPLPRKILFRLATVKR